MNWSVRFPHQGPPQAQGSMSLEAQADFPGADVQAGAEDGLLVDRHFPGRQEQVQASHPALSLL